MTTWEIRYDNRDGSTKTDVRFFDENEAKAYWERHHESWKIWNGSELYIVKTEI